MLLIMPTLTRWLSGPRKLPCQSPFPTRTPLVFCVCVILNEARKKFLSRLVVGGVNWLIKSQRSTCVSSLQFSFGWLALFLAFFSFSLTSRNYTGPDPTTFLANGGRIRESLSPAWLGLLLTNKSTPNFRCYVGLANKAPVCCRGERFVGGKWTVFKLATSSYGTEEKKKKKT
jgi:hypothetical protein